MPTIADCAGDVDRVSVVRRNNSIDWRVKDVVVN